MIGRTYGLVSSDDQRKTRTVAAVINGQQEAEVLWGARKYALAVSSR